MPSIYPDTLITQSGVAPTDQTARKIEFAMIGFGSDWLPGLNWQHDMVVRPEEITYTHPTRATVVQTLGGAFVDDFGEGITEIVVNGHTGWRHAPDPANASGNSPDGLERIYNLRYNLFQVYHEKRMEAAQNGKSPDEVRLYFFDHLHDAFYKVYPQSLQVRKNKTRPLLYQYQLRMIGLEKVVEDSDLIDATLDLVGGIIEGLLS